MIKNLSRILTLAAAAVLLGGCFSDDVTPQNTAIAGAWSVVCQPVNEDCSNFDITFAASGDIADCNLDGNRGAQRVLGEIIEGVLYFRMGVGRVWQFEGKLDGGGRTATGIMTNFDLDGSQKSTPAVVSRL